MLFVIETAYFILYIHVVFITYTSRKPEKMTELTKKIKICILKLKKTYLHRQCCYKRILRAEPAKESENQTVESFNAVPGNLSFI